MWLRDSKYAWCILLWKLDRLNPPDYFHGLIVGIDAICYDLLLNVPQLILQSYLDHIANSWGIVTLIQITSGGLILINNGFCWGYIFDNWKNDTCRELLMIPTNVAAILQHSVNIEKPVDRDTSENPSFKLREQIGDKTTEIQGLI
jgi:hypothetical protein